MVKGQKCGTQIVDSLMLEKYMLAVSLKVRETEWAFAHTLTVVNMKEIGKIIYATVREPLSIQMGHSRKGFSKMVKWTLGLDFCFSRFHEK